MDKFFVTFHKIYGTYTRGGHMSSNGYVTSGYNFVRIENVYCNLPLPPLSYQDAMAMKNLIGNYITSHSYEEWERDIDDCTYEEWIPGCSNELNALISDKYNIEIIGLSYKPKDCNLNLLDLLEDYTSETSRAISNVRDKWIGIEKTAFNNLWQLEQNLLKLAKASVEKLSVIERYEFCTSSLYEFVKNEMDNRFDVNVPIISFPDTKYTTTSLQIEKRFSLSLPVVHKTIYEDYSMIYALDVAFHAKDAQLVRTLLSKGAYKYSIIPLDWYEESELTDVVLLKKFAIYPEYNETCPKDRKPPYHFSQDEVVASLEAIENIREDGVDFETVDNDVSIMGISFSIRQIKKIRIMLAQIIHDWGRYNHYYPALAQRRLLRNEIANRYNRAFPKTHLNDYRQFF